MIIHAHDTGESCTASCQPHGAEYDAQFVDFTTAQLWEALIQAEAVQADRDIEFNEAIDAAVDAPYERLAEARAAVRTAKSASDEQGKLIAAINRAIKARTNA